MLHEGRLDHRAAELDGPDDDFGSELTVHSGNQVGAGVDLFRQFVEIGAVSEKLGAHRDEHMDRAVGIADGFEEKLDKLGGVILLFRTAALLVAEEFFKLIGDEQELLTGIESSARGKAGQGAGIPLSSPRSCFCDGQHSSSAAARLPRGSSPGFRRAISQPGRPAGS